MIGCMRYPDCTYRAFFPSFVLDAQVTERVCSRCVPRPVYKIKFQFKRGSVPPIMDLQHCTCILCDKDLQEVLNFKIKSPASSSTGQRNASARCNNGRNRNSNRNQGQSTIQNQPRNLQRPGGHAERYGNKNRNEHPRPPGHENYVSCNCCERAIIRTVRKEGDNKGREFFTCEKRACDFFLWADEGNSGNQTNHNQENYGMVNNRKRTYHAANTDEVLCQCRQQAVVRTVKKVGPNQHRQFYCCPKPSGQSCKFFEWLDGERPTQALQPARNAQNRMPGRKPRCCSICRQPGHTKNNCPRK